VGLSEVAIPGVRVEPTTRLPTTVDDLYDGLSSVERARFRQTPMDVLMTRERGGDGVDDEVDLRREFSTPSARDFDARAIARIDTSREDLLDRAEGVAARATSSSVFLDNPDLRASKAFDGDPTTGWLTGTALVGSSIQQRGPERDLSTISITQKAWTDDGPTNFIKAVDVYVDDVKVTTAALRRGRTTVALAADGQTLRGRELRLVVAADTDPTVPTSPVVSEIDGGLPASTARAAGARRPCLDIATVDGEPLSMRLSDPARHEWVGCGSGLTLAAGTHEVTPVDPSITVDSLDLLGAPASPLRPSPAPGLRFTSTMGSKVDATVGASISGDPYVLVLGQAFDDRWRASVDGKDLGRPFLVDGYAMGWQVDDPGSHDVALEFGPQRQTDAGAVVTGVGLLAVGALAVVPWRREPRAVPRREAVRRRRRVPPGARWLLLVAGVFAVASWTGLVAAAVLAAWHWFRAPDPRVVAVVGATLVGAAGVVTVVYLGAPGDFSYVAVGSLPNALATVGLVMVVLGGWRHRAETRAGLDDDVAATARADAGD
jgi:arabinofuranan 3-O-arabinosyltransferase